MPIQQTIASKIFGLALADSDERLSTPNLHMPLIAIAAHAMAVAVTQLGAAAAQRIIKLQTPHLSGLL